MSPADGERIEHMLEDRVAGITQDFAALGRRFLCRMATSIERSALESTNCKDFGTPVRNFKARLRSPV